jgi:hypothetical protein
MEFSIKTACNKIDTFFLGQNSVVTFQEDVSPIVLPCKALITTSMTGTESVNCLQSMMNKNDLQHVGCGSSGVRTKEKTPYVGSHSE